jgi:hypothetical protein
MGQNQLKASVGRALVVWVGQNGGVQIRTENGWPRLAFQPVFLVD